MARTTGMQILVSLLFLGFLCPMPTFAATNQPWIKTSDLQKEFYLTALQNKQDGGIQPLAFLETRIVRFQRQGSKLFLLQVPDGLFRNPEAAPEILLAEFPIVEAANGKIHFNFTAGFRKLFVESPWPNAEGVRGTKFKSAAVVDSRTQWIRRQGMELLISQQFAIQSDSKEQGLQPTQVTFSIAPRTNGSYRPFAAEVTDYPKYFTTEWFFKNDGSLAQNAIRYPNGPIEVYLSSKIPRRLNAAVRRGLLYWNKAFGEERIVVKEAGAGVKATDLKHRVFVEWAEDPNGAKAYAQWSADPLTGEILKTLIYLPSSFVGLMDGHTGLVSEEYSSLHVCDAESVREFPWDGTRKQRFRRMRLENDFSFLLAHELGHALGLRHNFAGKLLATYNPTQQQSFVDRFMNTFRLLPGHRPNGTVMTGGSAEEKTIIGEIFKNSKEALAYDKAAIAHLYRSQPYDRRTMPAHCTDSNRSTIGCGSGVGNPPLVGAAVYYQNVFKMIAKKLAWHYIAGLTPRLGKAKTVDQIQITDEQFHSFFEELFKARTVVMSIFDQNTFDIRVRKNFPKVDFTTERYVKALQKRVWVKEVTDFGGLQKFLFVPSAAKFNAMLTEVRDLLNGPLKSGEGENTKPYTLTEQQIQQILAKAPAFLQRAKHYVIDKDLQLLRLKNSISGHPLEEQLIQYYARRLFLYVTESSPNTVPGIAKSKRRSILRGLQFDQKQVRIPTAVHSPGAKISMINLLKQSHLTPSISARNREWVRSELIKWMKAILGGIHPEEVDLRTSSPVVKAWINEHLDLIRKI